MTNRRQFLAGLPVAAAGLGFTTTRGSSQERAAAEIAAAKERLKAISPFDAPAVCNPVSSGGIIDTASRDAFPNIAVTNQFGLSMAFYEGFIKDRVVLMNFMTIDDEAAFPVTRWLAGVVRELGDRVGRDVHVYSVTRDPESDTVSRMAAFAAEFDAPPGWQFLTGSQQHCSDLAFRMYRMGHGGLKGARKVDIAFYGNGGVGVWGTMPVGIQHDDAASRVAWVAPGTLAAPGALRRAGPRRVDLTDTLNHNREI